ncbi:MAG: alpha/beta hydrolase family protein [Longimicrobiales bacterium]
MRFRHCALAIALLAIASPALAQSGKKVLTQDDYDIWRTIQGAALSNDGQWAAYTVQPLVGEGELVVRNTRSGTEYKHTRGYTGRPPAPGMPAGRGGAAGGEGDEGPPAGPGALFSADSKYVLFMVQPSKDEVERAAAAAPRGRTGRGAGVRPPERNSLAIMSLADGKVTLIPGVRSFELAARSGKYVSYMLQADPPAQGQGGAGQAAADSTNRPKNRKTFGSAMVLRELATGTETRTDDVLAIEMNEDGSQLAYTVSSRATPAHDGLFLRSLATGAVTPVLAGVGNYRLLSFDRAGQQVTFVSDRDEYAAQPKPRFTLYTASVKAPAAKAVVTSGALSDGAAVADRGAVTFTRDGSAIQFAIAPVIPDSIPYDSLASKSIYDLWHYRDARLQSQQLLSLSRDRQRTFTGIYHIALNKFQQLTDDEFPNVTFSDHGKVALQNTGAPYAIEAMWGEGATDIYLTDAVTGARKLIKQAAPGNGTLSPGARYVTWFENAKWHAYNIATGKVVDLTGNMGVKFDQETHSTPSIPPAWGIAGWTPNDATVLVNDRYDVWELDPLGVKPARVVTDSVGRRTQTVFRVVNLDPEARFLDPAKPLLLRALDDKSKASGFYQDRITGNVQPSKIAMVDKGVGQPTKARDAEQYLITESTFQEFPNLYTGPSLTELAKISDANPQQSQYRWGSVEIVEWRTIDGVPTRGLLYKPEGFDPAKKYPMVVYFYETHTNTLHSYSAPSGRNIINVPVYLSKGYLVFEPDIVYKDGYPGPSALKTIVPGVQMLINKGFVKEDGVGIQGQSWGGYQTAYIITQSNLFKAAMAGAPVANMTSAYGGIRLESGNSRTSQYEHGQSRIGGSPWEYPERFIENSPLFYLDRVKTPLFIMHNDADGAVPWQQGIELYIGMRRLGKEAYMVNYNGDQHNPVKRANQRDMDTKMQEFFDHHLVGAPKPDWMKTGIPMLKKGQDQITPPKKVTTTTTTTSGTR